MKLPSLLTLLAQIPFLGCLWVFLSEVHRIRAKYLADGTRMFTGAASGAVGWQSSGILLHSCDTDVGIDDCFTLGLAAEGMLQPDQPGRKGGDRQRIEFYSTPYANTTETWSFSWKYHLVAGASSNHFFHLVQLLSRDRGGPLVTLDLQNNGICLNNVFDPSRCPKSGCPCIAQKRFLGRTTAHEMKVKFGEKGSFSYTVKDAWSQKTLLSYSFSDATIPAIASLKTGLYRGMDSKRNTPAEAYLGDFRFAKVG
ncbi:hypothetical protein JCM8097_000177 [Rhodosporidiobolus ruineniae]